MIVSVKADTVLVVALCRGTLRRLALSVNTSRTLFGRAIAAGLFSARYAAGGDIALSVGANFVLQAITGGTMCGDALAIFAFSVCPTCQICAIIGCSAGAQIVFYALPLARAKALLAGSGDTLACAIADACSGVPVAGTIDGNGRIGFSAAFVGVCLAVASRCHVLSCRTFFGAVPLIFFAAIQGQQGNTQSKQALTLHPTCFHG